MVVQNMLTILHQHRIHSLSAIKHQVRMEVRERLVVVQNMLTILHQHRIHSLSAIRHQVRMEEIDRLVHGGAEHAHHPSSTQDSQPFSH
jgi:hypothetical protein